MLQHQSGIPEPTWGLEDIGGPCRQATVMPRPRFPKLGSASWSEQHTTHYLVPETSTNCSTLSATPSMLASNTSCQAARRLCPKVATDGDMMPCWRSWQRWWNCADRRPTAGRLPQQDISSTLQGLARTSTFPACHGTGRETLTQQGSSGSPRRSWKHLFGRT